MALASVKQSQDRRAGILVRAAELFARCHHPAGDYPTGQLAQGTTAVFLHGFAARR